MISLAPEAAASEAPSDGQLHREGGQEEAGFPEGRRGLGTGCAVFPKLAELLRLRAPGITAFLL